MSDLINALRNQKQYDEHGEEVIVSRQACDEAADALEAQAKEIAELTQMVADLEGIRQIDVDEFNQLKTLCDLMGAALEEMLESCECDINAGRIAAREALEGQP